MNELNTDYSSSEYDALFVLAENYPSDSERIAVEPSSYWKSVFRLFLKKSSARLSLALLAFLVLGAVFIPILSPHGTDSGILAGRDFLRPSFTHWFGTDELGRDLLVTSFTALRLSFLLALIVALINTVVGIIIGTAWGYFKKLDPIMVEITNFIGNIPNMLIFLIILFILSNLNRTALASLPEGQETSFAVWITSQFPAYVITLTSVGWVGMARFIRNQVLIISDREYNLASKTLGTSSWRMIFYNILPFIFPVIITNISLAIPAAVAAETSLSFFGIGLRSHAVALGPLMGLGFRSWQNYPWVLLTPAAVLATLSIAFYLMGLALSDSLDPKLHR